MLFAALAALPSPPAADAYLSFAARDNLVAASGQLAWVETLRGTANVWHASEARQWTPTPLTTFKDEDVAISALRFVANGTSLIFAQDALADTNPLHRVDGSLPSATWLLHDVSAGQASLLLVANESLSGANDASALFARPNGGVGGQALWEVPLRAGSSPLGAARRLFTVKQGRLGDFAWSPDGEALAFANARASYGFVGVFRRGASTLQWVAPSTDQDVTPAWSADGSRLAWLRLRVRVGDAGYSPVDGDQGNRGADYSVMVADYTPHMLDFGRARAVFVDSTYGRASFGYGSRPLTFDGESLLFGTEAPLYIIAWHTAAPHHGMPSYAVEALSGWLHVARVPLDGSGAASELRPGACEEREWTAAGGWLCVAAQLPSSCGRGDLLSSFPHMAGTCRATATTSSRGGSSASRSDRAAGRASWSASRTRWRASAATAAAWS